MPGTTDSKLKVRWTAHPLHGELGGSHPLPGILSLTQQTLVVASWPSGPKGAVVWLVEDDWQLKLTHSALRWWAEVLPGSWLASHPPYVWPTVQAPKPILLHLLATNSPALVLTTIPALLEKTIHPEALAGTVTTVHVGSRVRLPDLTKRLVEVGFTRSSHADQPGFLAIHGGVADIWLERRGCTARLEFGPKTVERIQLVRRDGQREKLEPATSIGILPPTLPAAVRTSLGLAYLGSGSTLLTTPALRAEVGLRLHPNVHHLNWVGATAAALGAPVRLYHRRWSELRRDVDLIKPEGWQAVALSGQAGELREQLRRHGIDGVQVLPLPENVRALTGFRDERNKLVFLTDLELWGTRSDVQARRRKLARATAQALTEGDYVVHVDHGIGRFTGLHERQEDDATRQYLLLEYAGGDKLYLPIEQSDRISRYLGVAHPPLSKLDGGGSWATALRKVRAEAGELARQILLTAARRQVTSGLGIPDHPDEAKLADSFAYDETPDQLEAVREVLADMRKDEPMDRLLAGDVGFGKTEVAIRAALKAVRGGRQVAVLCPTTVLAQQHLDTFQARLKPFKVHTAVLSRFQSTAEQRATVAAVAAGKVEVVIGTHRLLSKDIRFPRLGLAIIDEEQKFGVKAKEQLKNLRSGVHVLSLSATPIPRTLNMALSGLRDISTIETPPPGRLPIDTAVLPYSDEVVREALTRELERGGQAYYVSNKVARIELTLKHLQKLMPKAHFSVGHGQMAEDKLAEVMHRFDEGEVDVLVCSTIVENGLDLPNVNTILIENAPALGLAQAYQLRGRVGRAGKQAYAYFLYPSQKLVGKPADRLRALMQHSELGSGFQIAMRDLELRGVGNALGQQQHGPAVSVGLNLYSRLLEETLLGMRDNRPPPDETEVAADLPLSAFIPSEVEPDQAQRLRLYQQLANEDEPGLDRYLASVTAHFPGMPIEPLRNLVEVLRLKILCRAAGVEGVDTTRNRTLEGLEVRWLRIKLGSDVAAGAIGELTATPPVWEHRAKENVLRIRFEHVADDLLTKLQTVVRKLAG